MENMINEIDFIKLLNENKNIEKNANTIYLNNSTTMQIDAMLEIINKNLNSNISKSVFIETAAKYLLSSLGNSKMISDFKNDKATEDHEILILTSSNKNNNYERQFLNNNYWITSNLSNNIITLISTKIIRFLSLYNPKVKGCEYYSEIKNIELITEDNLKGDQISDIGKYRINLKHNIKMSNVIKLKGTRTSTIVKGKKATLNKFLNIEYIEEL